MVDLRGTELQPEERELLLHPLVGGLILFTRNYVDSEQISALIQEVHALRQPRLLVAVDHEGGAVQRFRHGFTTLPPCGAYGRLYADDHRLGLHAAHEGGWLMAAELRSIGVDFSFAPVLDLGLGISRVVNDRAFARQPQAVTALARAFMHGMQSAGMAAVAKHFPGHGSVAADSHHEIPVDNRAFDDIAAHDLVPFAALVQDGLAGLMPAHVIYSQVDRRPAGFSPFWLQEVARNRLAFKGAIFSDDLSMTGAAVAGTTITERVKQALSAGCDMGLVCNCQEAVLQVVSELSDNSLPLSQVRLLRMHGHHDFRRSELQSDPRWKDAVERMQSLNTEPELDLDNDQMA